MIYYHLKPFKPSQCHTPSSSRIFSRNPVLLDFSIVGEFQKLSIEKWNEYIHTEALRKKKQLESKERHIFPGAGLTKKELREYNRMLEESQELGL